MRTSRTAGLRTAAAASALLLALGTAELRACPVCTSETGVQVRRGIFAADFASNLAASLLPFPIFLAVVGLIHGRPTGRAAGERSTGPEGGADG